MNRANTLLIGLSVAVTALLAGVYTGSRYTRQDTENAPVMSKGALARVFATSMTDVNGKPQVLAQWQGKTLVVNFWAAWCPPCREEMPGFSRLQGKYAANGVQFVGIALDSAENVKEFSRQFPVVYPFLLGGAEGWELLAQLGNPRLALPFTLLITPSGEVRFARLGALSERELDAQLQITAAR